MTVAFYLFAAVAIIATVLAITRLNAMHALLYLLLSLLALAGIFFVLGAPFAAMLEIIVYAGAIIVLFVFVVMMLNLGASTLEQERHWLQPRLWIGPSVLAVILLGQLLYVFAARDAGPQALAPVGATEVGLRLFGPYLLAVELASMLLLAGLVGAYRIARVLDTRGAETEPHDAHAPNGDQRAGPAHDAHDAHGPHGPHGTNGRNAPGEARQR